MHVALITVCSVQQIILMYENYNKNAEYHVVGIVTKEGSL